MIFGPSSLRSKMKLILVSLAIVCAFFIAAMGNNLYYAIGMEKPLQVELTTNILPFYRSDTNENSGNISETILISNHDVSINSAAGELLGKQLLAFDDQIMLENIHNSNSMIGKIIQWRKGVGVSKPQRTKCPNGSGYPRRIYTFRHSERINYAMGSWYQVAFNVNDTYQRLDLNMPLTIPRRTIHPKLVIVDAPLSISGHIHSWLLGHSLKMMGAHAAYAYSSPSLRCVETMNTLLLGIGANIHINVEPGLVEWFNWNPDAFMTPDELKQYHLLVNTSYEPIIPLTGIRPSKETLAQQYITDYATVYKVAKAITDQHRQEDGDIIIMGHSSTPDTFTRHLSGGKPATYSEYQHHVRRQPFGIMTVMEEDCSHNNKWHMVEHPLLPFDWLNRNVHRLYE